MAATAPTARKKPEPSDTIVSSAPAPAPVVAVGAELMRIDPPALGVIKAVSPAGVLITIADESREVMVPMAAVDMVAGTWTEAPASLKAAPEPAKAPPAPPPAKLPAQANREPMVAPAQEAPKVGYVAPPNVPDTHELAMWTGAGKYGGEFYTFPAGHAKPHATGRTLGYFPRAAVKKLTGQFEPYKAGMVGEPATPSKERPAGAEVASPDGYVLAHWLGEGKYNGAFLSFPERKMQPHAMGRTLGYFPEAAVIKLAGQFERV